MCYPGLSMMSNNDPAPVMRWQSMTECDVPDVSALANLSHPQYPERLEVMAEKFRLYPQGCFTLRDNAQDNANAIHGYCFSHPWTRGAPPALDRLLGTLPEASASYFIHDLTLGPSARGRQLAAALMPLLVTIARAIPLTRMALVAVNGSEPFWTRMGFHRTDDETLQGSVRAKYDASAVHMQRALA